MGEIYEVVREEVSMFATSKSPRHFFSMLLTHAAMNGDDSREEELRDDVCHMLVQSLSFDNECFSRWEEVYPRYIPQSNNLLLFIMLDWKNISSNVSSLFFFIQMMSEIKILEMKVIKTNIQEWDVSWVDFSLHFSL